MLQEFNCFFFEWLFFIKAGVAQLVELQPSKLNVASSSLVSRSILSLSQSIKIYKYDLWCLAHVAQLVERILGKDEGTGSNPVSGLSKLS